MTSTLELLWEHVYQPVCVHDGGIVTSIERGKDPCWWRVLDESGIGFIFGLGLGFGVNIYQGFRMAVPGKRFRVIRDRIVTQVPANGGSFAAWTTAFALTECVVIKLRGGTEDAINPTIAGAGAGFFTNFAGGRRAMIHGAKMGAILLGSMELLMNAYSAYTVNQQLSMAQEVPPPAEYVVKDGKDLRYSHKRRLQEFNWAPPVPTAVVSA
eukprot:TRINITY_DN23944_c0_g1_i2.p1 TRINITY_DN23944_c0_g1~~TRINITY_DN23944_c0_g1_i2.p1  ORF type:complete len:211 (+),score=19.50 TRINITY_DN23944_c0_g1_i2:55-687(+)